jgi:hypothetical protein
MAVVGLAQDGAPMSGWINKDVRISWETLPQHLHLTFYCGAATAVIVFLSGILVDYFGVFSFSGWFANKLFWLGAYTYGLIAAAIPIDLIRRSRTEQSPNRFLKAELLFKQAGAFFFGAFMASFLIVLGPMLYKG